MRQLVNVPNVDAPSGDYPKGRVRDKVGATIGTTLVGFDTFKQIFINVISGVFVNAPWFVLIAILGIGIMNMIKRMGENIIKNVPEWIEKYERIKRHERKIDWARGTK